MVLSFITDKDKFIKKFKFSDNLEKLLINDKIYLKDKNFIGYKDGPIDKYILKDATNLRKKYPQYVTS